MDELGIEIPGIEEPNWNSVRQTALEIVDGRIEPSGGARALWSAYDCIPDNGDLRIFVRLASEVDDHPEAIEELLAMIIAEARVLLSRPEPDTGSNFMADRDHSPITQIVGHGDRQVDMNQLKIGEALRSDVARWSSVHEDTLAGWPELGGFATREEVQGFVTTGHRLVERLQDELGPTYHVEYMPRPIQRPK